MIPLQRAMTLDDIDTEANIAANGDGDAAMASARNPDIESPRQFAEQIATSVSELEHIARSHHKNSRTADTMVKVLPFLREAILDGMDLTPVERVETAMQTIQERGHKSCILLKETNCTRLPCTMMLRTNR